MNMSTSTKYCEGKGSQLRGRAREGGKVYIIWGWGRALIRGFQPIDTRWRGKPACRDLEKKCSTWKNEQVYGADIPARCLKTSMEASRAGAESKECRGWVRHSRRGCGFAPSETRRGTGEN